MKRIICLKKVKQTCLWWSSSTLNLSGPTWIWVFFSKSTSIISDSNLWVVDGKPDWSCKRCLPLGKSFTWKKLESGSGKTDSILDGSLADLISTRKCECSSSILLPSTWQLKMVISGCSNTRKSNALISSDPTYKWIIYVWITIYTPAVTNRGYHAKRLEKNSGEDEEKKIKKEIKAASGMLKNIAKG